VGQNLSGISGRNRVGFDDCESEHDLRC
jgi:hypothetical protein